MPKPNKSSASSAMKKKQAAKKAGAEAGEGGPEIKHKPQRGQKGISKADKKKLKNGPKVYVAPPKAPQPVLPDPLDALGLSRTLPAELVVSLRRLGKKDGVTRRKALEEVLQDWAQQVVGETLSEEGAVERELKELALVDAVPVWLHNLPSLLLSPSHRGLALQVHATLLASSAIRASIMNALALDLLPGPHQVRDVLGSWLTAALEEGKRGAGRAGYDGLAAWEGCITWESSAEEGDGTGLIGSNIPMLSRMEEIIEYLRLSILAPADLDDEIHPTAVLMDVIQAEKFQKNSKASGKRPQGPPRSTTNTQTETPESEEAARAREAEVAITYRYTGVQGLVYVLERLPPDRELAPGLRDLLGDDRLWSMLRPFKAAGEVPQSPLVRRSIWALVTALLKHHLVHVTGVLERTIGQAVLSSAFREQDGSVWIGSNITEALAAVLTNFKGIWLIKDAGDEPVGTDDDDKHPAILHAEEDSSEGEDSGTDDDEENDDGDVANVAPTDIEGEPAGNAGFERNDSAGQRAYRDFLSFLQRGCNGNPMEGYPIVLLIIASLPDEILPNTESAVQALFASFWAPYYAKSLYTTPTPMGHSSVFAFLSSLMDTLSLLASKAGKAVRDDQAGFPTWPLEEYVRVWKDGIQAIASRPFRANRSVHGEKGTEPIQLAEIFGGHLRRLRNVDQGCSDKIGTQLCTCLVDSTEIQGATQGSGNRSIYLGRLVYLIEALAPYSTDIGKRSSRDIARRAVSRLQGVLQDSQTPGDEAALDIQLIARMMGNSGPMAIDSDDLGQDIRAVVVAICDSIVNLPPVITSAVLHEYIGWCGDDGAWASLAPRIAQRILQSEGEIGFQIAESILIGLSLPPGTSEQWQEVLVRASQVSIDEVSKPSAAALTRQALMEPDGLATADTKQHILALLSTALVAESHAVLVNDPTEKRSAKAYRIIDLLGPYIPLHIEAILQSEIQRAAIPALYRLAFLAESGVFSQASAAAASSWRDIALAATPEQLTALFASITGDLIDCIADIEVRPHPYAIVHRLRELVSNDNGSTSVLSSLTDILEKQQSSWLREAGFLHVSLDVLAPVPHVTSLSDRDLPCDQEGRTTYGRVLEAIVAMLSDNRTLLRNSPAVLLQTVLASSLSKESGKIIAAPVTLRSERAAVAYGQGIDDEIDRLISYATSPSIQDADLRWHNVAMASLSASAPVADPVQELMRNLAAEVERSGIHQRCLRDVLQRVLVGTGDGQITERWLASAQAYADKRPALARAVFAACAPLLSESPRLDRIRSDIASRLAGVPLTSANGQGARYLGLLQALVPPPDSVDSFLPQQRGIFLIRHLNDWLISDDEAADELSEEVESRILLVYREMSPIIQDVSGAHWDVIFDLIGTNLEGLNLKLAETYELGLNTLELVSTLSALALRNKTLAGFWADRSVHLKSISSIVTGLSAITPISFPLRVILDLCLEILDANGRSMDLDDAGLARLYGLLGYPYHSLQLFALRVIRKAMVSRTNALVLEIEAGSAQADATASTMPKIPEGLLMLLEQTGEDQIAVIDSAQAFAWTLVFDCFEGASAAVRTSYVDQLRSLGVMERILIPLVINAMRTLLTTRQEDCKVAVDEFYVELFSPTDIFSAEVLALHLLYRALVETPVLIRNWLEACKDKQLTNFFRGVVLKQFSPIIVEQEFSVLRTPTAIGKLQDENLTVKVLSGAAEVTVTYVIDEVPMEIVVRLPPEFPLKAVEIRDVQRVGVSEAKWRGWLLNVQQMITSRPGLLLDALTLYKGNITAHFEGKEECAICYSIISTVDRKLPKKACPTCHQIFHDSCLFQWFKSSNSSSCPLCRSIF